MKMPLLVVEGEVVRGAKNESRARGAKDEHCSNAMDTYVAALPHARERHASDSGRLGGLSVVRSRRNRSWMAHKLAVPTIPLRRRGQARHLG